jgi:hypothetical protein
VVTRTSRYGNPLNVALTEANFNRIRVPLPPKEDKEMEEWR